MLAPVIALSREILRRSQKMAWLIVGILAGCSLSAWLATDKARAYDNLEVSYFLLMMLSLALVFAIFHQAEFDPRRNWHGFPYRLFTLPVSTWILVGCPMLLGVLALELVYFVWARFAFLPLNNPISAWPAAVLAAGLPCYQALVWSLAGFRLTRLVALTLAGMIFMDMGALPVWRQMLPHSWEQIQKWLGLSLVVIAIGSFAASYFFVERQRRGGGRGRGWWRSRVARMVDALPRRRTDFESAASAQFWFEWRRAGWLLPVCTGAALIFIFLPISWFAKKDVIALWWTLGWLLALPIILATVIGHAFSKPDLWSAELSFPPFLAVRPLGAEEKVMAKMKVAAGSAALAWLLVLGFLALWLSLWADKSELRDCWEVALALRGPFALGLIGALILMFAFLLTWRGLVGSLWAGLSGNGRRYVLSLVIQVLAAFTLIRIIVLGVHRFEWKRVEQYVTWLQWALVLAIALKFWLAAFTWRKISPARTASYALMWTLGTALIVTLGLLLCPDIFWLKPLVIMAALLPFPLARLGLAPAALENNQHRL